MSTPKRPWIMNAFAMTAPSHLAAGLWRDPSQETQDLQHWIRLAKKLDATGWHGLFFADVLGIYDTYKSSSGPALASGAQIPILDVSYMIGALAVATESLCFGITCSTTYSNPYEVARKFATLDHITNGRIGWNIVTSYLDSAARSYGLESQIEHDERYLIADEFLEVFYKLVEGSWAEDAVCACKKEGIWTDSDKVQKINHVGKYFRCAGPSLIDPSPQRTPFILQAGASSAGKQFAAKHAEVMFLPGLIPAKTRAIVESTRKLLLQVQRAPESIRFIAGIFILVAETDAAAQAKLDSLLKFVNLEGTAALFGGWSGTDLSEFGDDEDFTFNGPPAIVSMINAWTETVPGTEGLKWTKRRVLEQLAIGGAHPRVVGSPTTVANEMQRWIDEGFVDGFNISYATTPGSFDDIITYLWPELRKRGVLRPVDGDKSVRTTMRESYLQDGAGPRVRQGHPATEFNFEDMASAGAS